MNQIRLICLAVSATNSYYRNVLRGVIEYAHSRPTWHIVLARPQPAASTLRTLSRADGVIACVNDLQWCECLLKTGIPLVNVDAVVPNLPVPRVNIDNSLVGEMAAAHFTERGLSSFGFVGQKNQLFSMDREAEFRRALAAKGRSVAVYDIPSDETLGPLGSSTTAGGDLGAWLRSLPRPAGVFTPYDLWGAEVIETCRQVSLRVPEDIAVLGVDNDELFCSVTRPPLSSIALPAEAVGVEAAARMDRLIDGRKLGLPGDVLLPPSCVIPRQSSDVLAADDEHVRAALAFVRDNFRHHIQVSDVVGAVGISRRSLERRVVESIGTTLGTLIRNHQLESAKQLLVGTDLPISIVAARCGYTDSRRIESAFAQALGRTPSSYRRVYRGRLPDTNAAYNQHLT